MKLKTLQLIYLNNTFTSLQRIWVSQYSVYIRHSSTTSMLDGNESIITVLHDRKRPMTDVDANWLEIIEI